MAKLPTVLVQNFFNDRMYPGHVITATSEAPRHQVWRVGTGRRKGRSILNSWRATSAISQVLTVDCGAAKPVDTLVVDRGSVPGGQFHVQRSADGVTWANVFPQTTWPAAVGSDLDAGVLTDEGAFAIRFAEVSFRYYRFRIATPPVIPEITGLWLGKSYAFEGLLDLPYDDLSTSLIFNEASSTTHWRGRTDLATVREGTMIHKLNNHAEFVKAKAHILDLFGVGYPMWIFHNPEEANRAVLAERTSAPLAYVLNSGWAYRQANIDWVEVDPKPL